MEKDILEVIEKFSQYEHIPYAKAVTCTECSRADFKPWDSPDDPGFRKPELVGWCDTPIGFMGIFKCTYCGSLFRFHCCNPLASVDDLKKSLLKWALLCANYQEIASKLED